MLIFRIASGIFIEIRTLMNEVIKIIFSVSVFTRKYFERKEEILIIRWKNNGKIVTGINDKRCILVKHTIIRPFLLFIYCVILQVFIAQTCRRKHRHICSDLLS